MKFPHIVILLLGLAITVLTWVLQQQVSGAVQLTATCVACISTVLTVVKTILALSTDSVQTSMRAKAALSRAGTSLIAAALGMLALMAMAAGCSSCSAVTPTVATDVTAGVNFAVCVLGQVAQCEAASPPTPWPTCSVNIISACGGSALQVAQVVDAHNAALIKAGFVPKVLVDAGVQ
jgi:hypothetical protein